ncbi:hypothetical protein [Rhizobium ruizarguesonis]
MDDNQVSVTLAAPAKIGGKYFGAGATVSVSTTVAGHLGEEPFDTSDTPIASDFEAAVAAAAKALATTMIDAAVHAAVAEIVGERDGAVSELAAIKITLADANAKVAAATDNEEDAAGKITALRERVTELETALAAATKPDAGTTPAPATTKQKK